MSSPLPDQSASNNGSEAAMEMIRRKIAHMYAAEPNARQESAEVERLQVPRSKHQEVMHRLTNSGRSMAEIQQAWHQYYLSLPDREKHEVWQEFYQANARSRERLTAGGPVESAQPQHAQRQAEPELEHQPPIAKVFVHEHEEPTARHKPDRRSLARVKRDVLKKVRFSHNSGQKAKQHLQSLAFGLGLGALTLLIALFGLFNELVITPFIRPGSAAATPIILDANAPAPDGPPQLIIPKLNAQLPVMYDVNSLDEADVQQALQNGVFHYPTTANPGQNGNLAIFGHSSNNILNKGKYKFAFVLLHQLEPGDIFYLTFQGKVYTYKVYTKKVINPDETAVLGPAEGKIATATLITCDPPGSTKHRLVVWGEQVTPDPASNSAAAEPSEALQTQSLPDNGPSAWTRLWRWLNPFD